MVIEDRGGMDCPSSDSSGEVGYVKRESKRGFRTCKETANAREMREIGCFGNLGANEIAPRAFRTIK